jgi:AraC-like DNA-binding protein
MPIRMQDAEDARIAVSTHRPEEASALLARSFPGLRLEVPRGARPFVFRHSAYGSGPLRAYELAVSGPSIASGSLPADRVSVGHVLAGRFEEATARQGVDPSLPFLRTAGPAMLRMHDVHLRLVTLDTATLRRIAMRAEDAGGPHLRLVRGRPISPAAAGAWRWMADRVHETMRDQRAAANPIVMDELLDTTVRMLLRCFGDASAREESTPSGSPAALRRAVAYLEEHANASVTMPDVAAAARVSVRSLQVLFRRHLGVTPVEHLHGIRLEAARRELLEAAQEGPVAIGEVAARWGFANSGRFARVYAARFGELPHNTLRLAR